MSAPTNYWKLGAFVVGSVVVGLVAVALLMAQTLQVVAVTYASYFDEAVTGLEVGLPVTYRGVRVGNVTAIDVAPDRRHVEVVYSLGVAVLTRLGLTGASHGKETRIPVPPNLRVQITSTGLTGTKYLQIDFFETDGAPPPVLPFPVPENTIPAIPSTMKGLEDAVVRAVAMLPELTHELGSVVSTVNLMIQQVEQRKLPDKAVTTLDNTNRLVASLQAKLDQLPVAELSREATLTLREGRQAVVVLAGVLARLDGKEGLLASMRQTSNALGDSAPGFAADLGDTSRDLREAAVAVRQLVEALQRDPDMLLKGKTQVRP